MFYYCSAFVTVFMAVVSSHHYLLTLLILVVVIFIYLFKIDIVHEVHM